MKLMAETRWSVDSGGPVISISFGPRSLKVDAVGRWLTLFDAGRRFWTHSGP